MFESIFLSFPKLWLFSNHQLAAWIGIVLLKIYLKHLSCNFYFFIRNSRKYINNSFHLVTQRIFPNLFLKFLIEMR
jgi:hypothetical protein